jgi:hypothetical protein
VGFWPEAAANYQGDRIIQNAAPQRPTNHTTETQKKMPSRSIVGADAQLAAKCGGSALHYRSNRHPVLLLRANDLGFRAKDGAVLIHST